jgi:hypothetical protein
MPLLEKELVAAPVRQIENHLCFTRILLSGSTGSGTLTLHASCQQALARKNELCNAYYFVKGEESLYCYEVLLRVRALQKTSLLTLRKTW